VASPLATSYANITGLLATNERYAAVQYALPRQTHTLTVQLKGIAYLVEFRLQINFCDRPYG